MRVVRAVLADALAVFRRAGADDRRRFHDNAEFFLRELDGGGVEIFDGYVVKISLASSNRFVTNVNPSNEMRESRPQSLNQG